jgi:maleylacetoacetate isomerase
MRLYSAARSSASFRVRIALALKDLDYEVVPISLLKGDQFRETFRAVNPAELVPVLEHNGRRLSQSLAIIEYLDEIALPPPLLPADAVDRAYVRAVALSIACDIHPLNNLRVLRYLKHDLGLSEEAKDGWYRHWVEKGLGQLEHFINANARAGRYALGDTVTMADVCIVPQIFNAQRYHCTLDHVPTIMRIFDACMALPAFQKAQPERQPDFAV